MVEAPKESPADRDEGAGTPRVQITPPSFPVAPERTHISLFLLLVLAPGEEAEEGEEPDTHSDFMDIKGT